MQFTLGCPSTQCSDWDYTVTIFAEFPTSRWDSTRSTFPFFRVNGAIRDTLNFRRDTTYSYFWNSTTRLTDSTPRTPQLVRFYRNAATPTVMTDSLYAWPCNYKNFKYDTQGRIIDSVFVQCDTAIYLTYHVKYNPYEIIDRYELGRLITPYSNGRPLTWTHRYRYDITDFADLLKDSVTINVLYSGYSDGFAATVDFEFVEGTPPRPVIAMKKLYQGYFNYGRASKSIETDLIPYKLKLESTANEGVFKIWQTGHGGGGNENCAEFCPKTNYLYIDSQLQGSNLVWKACGNNAIWAQPGTWIYDRANWCPGEAIDPYTLSLNSIVTPGDSFLFDFDMQPYTYTGGGNQPGYQIFGMYFQYGPFANANDASVERILSPNNNENYTRINPICSKPVIELKNLGSQVLRSATIQYGVPGNLQTYQFSGGILPMQTKQITLPGLVNFAAGTPDSNTFVAIVSNPNGATDGNTHNDTAWSAFTFPSKYPSSFLVVMRTNSAPSETTWKITDLSGNVVARSRSGLNATTTYQDSVNLPMGCYSFIMEDSGNDGLYFQSNGKGTGSMNIRTADGTNTLVDNYPANFGTKITRQFTVGYVLSTKEISSAVPKFSIYPNPNNGSFTVSAEFSMNETGVIRILNGQGQWVMNRPFKNQAQLNEQFSEGFTPGIYMAEIVLSNGKKAVQKFIVK